jgi:hypothetical protein
MKEVAEFMGQWGWQLLTLLVTLVIGVPTLVLMAKQQTRKRLDYRILFRSLVVNVSPGFKGRVRVLFDDQPVERLEAIGIEFTNSGNIPILRGDFEGPIKVGFGPQARLITLAAESEPANVAPSLSGDIGTIQISALMVNPRDVIRITTLVSAAGDVSIEGRIAGVSQIQEITERRGRYRPVRRAVQFLILIVLFALLFWAQGAPAALWVVGSIIGFLGFALEIGEFWETMRGRGEARLGRGK